MSSKAKKRVGAPSKCTPERVLKLCSLLRGGAFFKHACEEAGINEVTGWRWVQAGEEDPDGEYGDAAAAIKLASAAAINRAAECVYSGGEQWAARARWLESRDKEGWLRRSGKSARLEELEAKKLELEMELLKKKLSGELPDDTPRLELMVVPFEPEKSN